MERFMITNNSVVEIQKLVVNHESRSVKWNPEEYDFSPDSFHFSIDFS